MEPYIGQIMLMANNYAPKYWAQCDGQLLSIQTNQALFSILGTTYGGDGVNNFRLPDLRGRIATHFGQGKDLTNVTLGQVYGTEKNKLTETHLPPHTHTATGTVSIDVSTSEDEESDSPVDCYLKKTTGVNNYATSTNAQMGPTSVRLNFPAAGSSQPVNNMQPTLTLLYCIALQGIFPRPN